MKVQRHLKLALLTVWTAAWGCTCDSVDITTEPGTVEALLCGPVSGAREGGHLLLVDTEDGTKEATSGGDGWARLQNLTAGPVTIRLRHVLGGTPDARLDHVLTAQLKEAETITVLDPACLDVPLAPGRGGIQGQVCNRHTGELLRAANVTAVHTSGETRTTQTNEGGFFLLLDVAAGDHVVTVQGQGYQRAFPARVEAGEVTALPLGANCSPFDPNNTGSVGGKLCVENGAGPWTLAVVRVLLGDGRVLQDTTDVDGQFLIEGVPPGEHDVTVEGGGEMATYRVTVNAGETASIQPAMDCPVPNRDTTGDVRGQLCDPDVGGWLVGALAQAVQGARTFQDHTDARGRFHLAGLTPGDVEVVVTKGSYRRVFNVPITAAVTVQVADGVCAPPTWQCLTQELTLADTKPLRIMLVVDKSGSMSEQGLDGVKWDSAVDALTTVTQRLQEQAAFGMALFPAGDALSATCEAGNVVVAPAEGNATQIATALNRASPGGGTPTGPSVGVVHQWLEANPADVTTLVILATDGVPNCNEFLDGAACACPVSLCPANPFACCVSDPRQCCLESAAQCLDDNATINAIRNMAGSDIATYVIGLPGSEDPTDVLTRMAQAGGTNAGNGRAYYRPTSAQGLADDIESIVQSNRACRFDLDGIPNDPAQMEVRLNGTMVPRDQGRRQGWDLVGERGVELYGTSCTSLRMGAQATVAVRYCTDA